MSGDLDALRAELRTELRAIWADVRLQLGAIVSGAVADRTIATNRDKSLHLRVDQLDAKLDRILHALSMNGDASHG